MKNITLIIIAIFVIAGCGKPNSSQKNAAPMKSEPELDFLGMPTLKESDGWTSYEDRVNRMINYLSYDVKKVKVRGMYGRYISYATVLRYYQKPKSGTPTQIHSSGYTTFNCDEYGYCSGYGPTITTIPGTAGSPGGAVQLTGDIVIDCLDGTYKTIYKNFPTGKWKRIKNGSHVSSFRIAYCDHISNLPISAVKRYEKGKPKNKDFKALKVLPNNSY